jgi:hypothetical protein
MTAFAHPTATVRSWRTFSGSPIAAAEMAAIIVVALLVTGTLLMRARAAMQSAQANMAAAEIKVLDPVVSAYGLDHSGYSGMTSNVLKQDYGVGMDTTTTRTLEVTGASANGYCIQVRDGAWYAAKQGPSGAIQTSHSQICH